MQRRNGLRRSSQFSSKPPSPNRHGSTFSKVTSPSVAFSEPVELRLRLANEIRGKELGLTVDHQVIVRIVPVEGRSIRVCQKAGGST
jgi:hypothetical protein